MNCPWCGTKLIFICTPKLKDKDDRLISDTVRERGKKIEEYEKVGSSITSTDPRIMVCHKCNEVLAVYGKRAVKLKED